MKKVLVVSNMFPKKYYIVDGVNGYKFPMGDSVELHEKIKRFYALPEETKNVMKKGATNVAKGYSNKVILSELKMIFEVI